MTGCNQVEPDEAVLSLNSKRVMKNSCCGQGSPGEHGMCSGCGKPYRAGSEAYEVKLQLPNGVQFRDPAVQEHLRQVVPSDWPGVITTLEKSDRDSSTKRNNYVLTLTKRRPETVNTMANKDIETVKKSTLLPALIKICDGLDVIGEAKSADHVDEMIRSITANEDSCQNCQDIYAGIADLRRYLMSPKFHQDTTVQVNDVLMRLDSIEWPSY